MAALSIDSAGTLRDWNRLRIVDALRRSGSATRGDLARSTGLSRTTVASLVADLQASGLVADGAEQRRKEAGRGRPPTLLRLHRAAGTALGVVMGERSLHVAVADLASTVLAERRVPLDGPDAMRSIVDDVLEEAGTGRGELRGATVAVAAPRSSDLGASLTAQLGIAVQIEDETNLAALGEHAFGAGRERSDVVYVNLSSRIGAGLVLGRRLYRGATGFAGELGHVEANPDGALCRCGNRGCLETVASTGAVLDLLRPVHGAELELEGVMALVAAGDSGARRVLEDAGRAVGRVLAGVCNCLNPQAILVGGELAAAGEPLLAGIRMSIDRYAQPEISALVTVERASLGDRAALLGALGQSIGRRAA